MKWDFFLVFYIFVFVVAVIYIFHLYTKHWDECWKVFFSFLYFKINKLNNELINYCEILSTNTALPALFPRTRAPHAGLWAREATSIVFRPLRAASSVPLGTSQALKSP